MGGIQTLEPWSAIYQAQLANYQTALSNDHNMDSKAGVMLAGIFAVAAFALSHELFTKANRWQFCALIIGLVLYCVALTLLCIGLIPRSYTLPANTTNDHPEYLGIDDAELMYQLIVDAEFATASITGHLRKKSVLFSISTMLFIIGTFLLLITKLVQV